MDICTISQRLQSLGVNIYIIVIYSGSMVTVARCKTVDSNTLDLEQDVDDDSLQIMLGLGGGSSANTSSLQSTPVSKRSGINKNISSRLSRTNKNSICGASSATKKYNTITPHTNQQLNVYQKHVKRPSSGSIGSVNRPSTTTNRVGKMGGKREEYTQYDPALKVSPSYGDESAVKVKGNAGHQAINDALYNHAHALSFYRKGRDKDASVGSSGDMSVAEEEEEEEEEVEDGGTGE